MEVAYPFLLKVYEDYENNIISEDEFVEILRLIQSYVFRRFVCGIPTNSLNKTFANLYASIKLDKYLESFKVALSLMKSYKRFPKDSEVENILKEKNLYEISSNRRKYYFSRLENHQRKERVNMDEYTIEHIMPQNPNLSEEWKNMLGDDWANIQETYLHTAGNLTLTGSNSEMGDKPFLKKKKTGFNDSPLRLNVSLRKYEAWTKETILERTKELAMLMLEVWPYPDISDEILEYYKEKPSAETIYSIADHKFLNDGSEMREIFDILRKKILNLDTSVKEEFLKLYVAYKADTNFVDIVAQKRKLRLSLNVEYGSIHDPKELCHDVSNKGRWGNGGTEIHLSHIDQLEDAIYLIKQAFERNFENYGD